MPTYAYKCPTCQSERDVFCKIAEMDEKIPECHGKMERQIQAVSGYVQMACHYVCPVTRKGVTSWKERKELFAKHNLRDASDWNPAQEITKQKKKRIENETLAANMPHVSDLPHFGEKLNG